MRKHGSSFCVCILMILLAFGSSSRNDSRNANQSASSNHYIPEPELVEEPVPEPEADIESEIKEEYEKQHEAYTKQLVEWKRKVTELEQANATVDLLALELQRLKENPPAAPTFSERRWTTSDGQFSIDASFVDASSQSVTLRRKSGATTIVDRSKLSDADLVFTEKARTQLEIYRLRLNDWSTKAADLSQHLQKQSEALKPDIPQQPAEPSIAAISKAISEKRAAHAALEKKRRDIIAAEEKARLDREEAENKRREIANRRPPVEKFMETLRNAGITRDLIVSVSAKDKRLTIEVANIWHIMAYQIRLQAAQNLWSIWAGTVSPDQPDYATIKIVDGNGNEVGGSGFLGVWVQKE